jgi:bla regulator protein blaR1
MQVLKLMQSLLLCGAALAQNPAFEEASIKPAKPGASGMPFQLTAAGGFMATHISVSTLVQMSYDKKPFLIRGLPAWAENKEWAIVATPMPGTPPVNPPVINDDFRTRLKGLLASRFQMKSHTEQRESPVYVLVVAKGGPKFPEPDGKPFRLLRTGGGSIVHQGTSRIPLLVSLLANNFDRPVLDETGLTGSYNLNLKWTPDPKPGAPTSATTDPAGPSLFTALEEQLGLKLQAARRPIEVLVIDHIDHPTEN